MSIRQKISNRVHRLLGDDSTKKYIAEVNFWQAEIEIYKKWYNGEIEMSYGTPSPAEKEKVTVSNLKDSAILTWHKMHQEPKYLSDLQVSSDFFKGKLLDVGSGPMPSATCFKHAELYCLEPLLSKYLDIGFPIHYYGNTKYIQSNAEKIPVEDGFFDSIISVNALDHVDDFERTAAELIRILKPGGSMLFHLHYHFKTITEPVELNDDRVMKAFSKISNFRKVGQKNEKFGSVCEEGESYTLWTNIQKLH